MSEFKRGCKYCPAQIVMKKIADKWVAYNVDGLTKHTCERNSYDDVPATSVRDKEMAPKTEPLPVTRITAGKRFEGLTSQLQPDALQVLITEVTKCVHLLSEILEELRK